MIHESECSELIGSCYIGTVFHIMPSGKYWQWSADNNVTRIEKIKDLAFWGALQMEAKSRNMWVEPSEHDPRDLFVSCWVELD
jgi:hypothetical protein